MNCLEFRRQILADPALLNEPELQEHVEVCQQCAMMAAETASLDKAIYSALEIDLPSDLTTELLIKIPNKKSAKAKIWPKIYAFAASVTLLVGSVFVYTLLTALPYDQLVLAHIHQIPKAEAASVEPSMGKINNTLAIVGLKMMDMNAMQQLRFVDKCEVERSVGAHFIYQGKMGPVTVLLLPDKISHRKAMHDRGYDLMMFPTEYGSVVIVSTPGEAIDRYENMVIASFQMM